MLMIYIVIFFPNDLGALKNTKIVRFDYDQV
jgi:hypothetical protein